MTLSFALEVTAALALLVSVLLIHELGHWCFLRYFQIPIREVGFGFGPNLGRIHNVVLRLIPLGAYVSPDPEKWTAASARQRLVVALAGPLANLTYAGSLQWFGSPVDPLLDLLIKFNLLVAALNMLPVPPLDGWEALTSLSTLGGYPPSQQAQYWSVRIGNGFIWGLAGWWLGETLVETIRHALH